MSFPICKVQVSALHTKHAQMLNQLGHGCKDRRKSEHQNIRAVITERREQLQRDPIRCWMPVGRSQQNMLRTSVP